MSAERLQHRGDDPTRRAPVAGDDGRPGVRAHLSAPGRHGGHRRLPRAAARRPPARPPRVSRRARDRHRHAAGRAARGSARQAPAARYRGPRRCRSRGSRSAIEGTGWARATLPGAAPPWAHRRLWSPSASGASTTIFRASCRSDPRSRSHAPLPAPGYAGPVTAHARRAVVSTLLSVLFVIEVAAGHARAADDDLPEVADEEAPFAEAQFGPRYVIDEVVVRGNAKTAKSIILGAGLVLSTKPIVPDAHRGLGIRVRGAVPAIGGPYGLALSATGLFNDGSEFYRVSGADGDADPGLFRASRVRRAGGVLNRPGSASPSAPDTR